MKLATQYIQVNSPSIKNIHNMNITLSPLISRLMIIFFSSEDEIGSPALKITSTFHFKIRLVSEIEIVISYIDAFTAQNGRKCVTDCRR